MEKTVHFSKVFKVLLLLLIFLFNQSFSKEEIWTDFMGHNQTITCQGSQDPEPYKVQLYESPCKKKNDPVLKWACENGFTIVNNCMLSHFEKREIAVINNKKYLIKYCTSAYIDWGQGGINCEGIIVDDAVIKANKSVYEDRTVVYSVVDIPYLCKDPNDEAIISKCKSFKEKAKAYFLSLKAVVEGGKVQNVSEKNDTENQSTEEINITVSAEHPDYEPAVVIQDVNYLLSQKGWNISDLKEILLEGKTLSGSNFIPYSTVEIKFKENIYKIKSNSNGEYSKSLNVNPNGTKSLNVKIDLYLTKKEQNVKVKVLSKNLIANGKKQKILLLIEQEDGKPASNKTYSIYFNKKPITHNGKNVNFAVKPFLAGTIKTNENGKGYLIIQSLKVDNKKLNNIKNTENYFPITANLNIEGRKKVGEFQLSFESPFPKIEKFLLPCGMDAEHWQLTPSKIFIKDLDSNSFFIELRGYGRFKEKQGKIYKTLYRNRNYKGKTFEFYFASLPIGLDLNKQPDLLMAFLETNIKVAINFLIAVNEGYSFDRLRQADSISLTNKLDYDTVYNSVKLGFGAREYYNGTLSFLDNKKKDYVSTADVVVGGVLLGNDVINLIKKTSSTLGESLQIEVAKAIYENAKTMYSLYKEYRKISDSYKDIVFIPILIKITDNDGYSTSAVGSCGVRIWKEVN